MNQQAEDFLKATPDHPMRSCLEPHRDLIRELRRKRYPYRKIAHILQQHFALKISKSAIHDFIKVRSRNQRRLELALPPPPHSPLNDSPFASDVNEAARLGRAPSSQSSAQNEVYQRMQALKQRAHQAQRARTEEQPIFQYTEGRPLTLIPKERKD